MHRTQEVGSRERGRIADFIRNALLRAIAARVKDSQSCYAPGVGSAGEFASRNDKISQRSPFSPARRER